MVSIHGIVRFLWTPKGLLTLVLTLLIGLAAWHEGPERVAPGLGGALAAAILIDAPILRVLRRRVTSHKWEYPSGAVLTAMFVSVVLSLFEPWYVPAATTAIAVLSKYIFRTRAGNVLNPAALAIVLSFYLFQTSQSWWGALPDLPLYTLALLVVSGVFITDRVNKMPLAVTFLGVYFALFTAIAYLGDPSRVVEIFRAPDLHAVLFFAFFFLTDPPTSPVSYQPQIVCGVIVAVASVAIFQLTGAVHYLLSGVLVGNLYEMWNRGRPLTLAHFRAGRAG